MKIVTASIAMATYNGEMFLREQLDSIYSQTVLPSEVVVSDDCSTDATVAILQEYADNYGLKYSVNQSNIGFTKNFERAISLCQYEYIALADQDDIWLPNKLKTLIDNIGTHDVICSDAILVDAENREIASSYRKYAHQYIPTSFTTALNSFYVTGCTILMRNDFVRSITPFPEAIHFHDYWIGITSMKRNGIKYLPKPLIRYRQHGKNQVGSKTRNPLRKALELSTAFKNNKKIIEKQYISALHTQKNIVLPQLQFISQSSLSLSTYERKRIDQLIAYVVHITTENFSIAQILTYLYSIKKEPIPFIFKELLFYLSFMFLKTLNSKRV